MRTMIVNEVKKGLRQVSVMNERTIQDVINRSRTYRKLGEPQTVNADDLKHNLHSKIWRELSAIVTTTIYWTEGNIMFEEKIKK